LVDDEAEAMVHRDGGLHLWARVKEGGRGSRIEELITWNDVEDFRFSKMEEKAKEKAPVMWHLMSSFAIRDSNGHANQVTAYCYRPKNLVRTSVDS
jgi:hypothetical protein